jgi:hypothetical protein
MLGIIASTGWERSSAWIWDLLVHAQHHRPLGRVVIQPDDIDDLVDKQWIGRQLEGVGQVRLEAEGPPDPPDRRLAQP